MIARHPHVELVERARGAMLGLACGDALGAQVEFMARDSFPQQTHMTGGGPHRLGPGEWTDDTAMTLALADSIMREGRLDSEDVMRRWISWMETGEYSCTGECFDIGSRTRLALLAWKEGGPGLVRRLKTYPEGNGALMRVLPVALRFFSVPSITGGLAAQQARLTHGPMAAQVCGLYVSMMGMLLCGGGREGMLKLATIPEIGQRTRDELSSVGRAVDTFEAAIWCVLRTSTAEEAIIEAVSLGDDADTVGAVTGSIAGALYGPGALPERWLRKLAWRPRLEATATALAVAGLADIHI